MHRVAWPSGLRRWFKAPVSSEAWVRIPPLPYIFFTFSMTFQSFWHTHRFILIGVWLQLSLQFLKLVLVLCSVLVWADMLICWWSQGCSEVSDLQNVKFWIWKHMWLNGLGVWFSLWVREVPGSNPGWAHLLEISFLRTDILRTDCWASQTSWLPRVCSPTSVSP